MARAWRRAFSIGSDVGTGVSIENGTIFMGQSGRTCFIMGRIEYVSFSLEIALSASEGAQTANSPSGFSTTEH
jgi:hypothetical protein